MGEGASCLRSGPESDGGGGMTKFQNCQEKKYLINWTERFKFFGFYVKKQLIRDIIDYIDMENEEGIIVFLD